MGDLLSLSAARKAKARAEARAQAQANRVKFGRNAADKARDAAEAKRLGRQLDNAERDLT